MGFADLSRPRSSRAKPQTASRKNSRRSLWWPLDGAARPARARRAPGHCGFDARGGACDMTKPFRAGPARRHRRGDGRIRAGRGRLYSRKVRRRHAQHLLVSPAPGRRRQAGALFHARRRGRAVGPAYRRSSNNRGIDASAISRDPERTLGLYLISLEGAERRFSYWRTSRPRAGSPTIPRGSTRRCARPR